MFAVVGVTGGSRIAPSYAESRLAEFDVRQFGAHGDGLADDTLAIQAAINVAQARANGGMVYLPPGQYLITSSRRTSATTNSSAQDGMALVIAGQNVHLRGAGMGRTRIIHNGFGNRPFANSWQIVNGKVWRGHGIMVLGGSVGISFSDFEMTGGAAMTGNDTLAVDPITGDGWDITHKAIYLQADGHFDNTSFERVHLHHYRGEIVYGAGSSVGSVRCVDSIMHDTNGDCWSVQAACEIRRNHFYNAAANCIDGVQGGFDGRYTVISNNHLDNAGVCGIYSSVIARYGPLGPLQINNNIITNARVSGIALTSPHRTIVVGNELIDCGWGEGARFAIQVTTNPSTSIRDLQICRNSMHFVHRKPSKEVMIVVDNNHSTVLGVIIEDNIAIVDNLAEHGFKFSWLNSNMARIARNQAILSSMKTNVIK